MTDKLTMAIIVLLMAALLVAIDLFAFENGAHATISQVWLTLNRKCWLLTYLLVVAVGILVQHVSVPKDPTHFPDPPFWPQALLWTPFFWLGLWIGFKWLWQLPNSD